LSPYTECKKRADEAPAHNGLVIARTELTKVAAAERSKVREAHKD
jgi:hypothetical protein